MCDFPYVDDSEVDNWPFLCFAMAGESLWMCGQRTVEKCTQ